MTWRTAQTGWSRLALRSSGSRRQYTLASYEQFALGYLAVVRKEEGALIGRCGLMDLVVESAAHPSAEGPLAARCRTVGRAAGQMEVVGLAWDRYVWPLATVGAPQLQPATTT
jgi:hypothetical protein